MNRKHGSAKRPVEKETKRPVLLVYVLDETGSMACVKTPTISGFNEYVDGLRKKDSVRMTLTSFSTEQGFRRRCENLELALVPRLDAFNYIPSGGTPLYDAIADSIASADRMASTHDVLFVIQTDGEENSSKEFDRAAIMAKIDERKAKGWTFIFMGADQDAWKVAQSIGVPAANSVSYDNTSHGTRASFATVAAASSSYLAMNMDQRANATSNLVSLSVGGEDGVAVDLRVKKGRRN